MEAVISTKNQLLTLILLCLISTKIRVGQSNYKTIAKPC